MSQSAGNWFVVAAFAAALAACSNDKKKTETSIPIFFRPTTRTKSFLR